MHLLANIKNHTHDIWSLAKFYLYTRYKEHVIYIVVKEKLAKPSP